MIFICLSKVDEHIWQEAELQILGVQPGTLK